MHVKFDALNRFEVPQFTVCSPGSTYNNGAPSRTIGILVGTDSEELVLNFNATSELNLRVNKISSEDPETNNYFRAVYNALQNRRMIFVDNVGYFIITKVVDGYDGSIRYKDITAESCEVEIRNKQLPLLIEGADGEVYNLEGTTLQFRKLLELIVSILPSWAIGEVDSAVENKYRTFEDIGENMNVLGFMLENMQDAYECIFVFDCINRKINVFDQNNYVRLTDIQISKDDVINSIDITESSDDLYTALSVSSNGGVLINAVNPTGKSVIYNFDYYLDWMSDDLREKISAWMNLIEEKEQPYYDLNLEYYNLWSERDGAEAKRNAADAQVNMYTKCADNLTIEYDKDTVLEYINLLELSEDVTDKIEGDLDAISGDVAATKEYIIGLRDTAVIQRQVAETEINNIQAEMDRLKLEADAINDECEITSFLTEVEYAELSNYIYEGTYLDDYVVITDSMTYAERFQQMKTLYDRSKSQLLRVSYPTQEFDLDVENFIFEKEFAEWSNQLETGVLINVELDADDVAALFLSNITVNYDDQKLTMTFGNRFNKYDPKALFEKVLGNIQKSSNSINFIKDLLYPIKSGEYDAFKEFVDNSRTLTKNAALAATDQTVVIDDTGYLGRKLDENEESGFAKEQIKITNNSIVFTDDAWDSCKTALGKIILDDGTEVYGLNAQVVIGEIIVGGQLHIIDDAGNDMFSVVDNKISAVVKDVSDVSESITTLEATADGLKIEVSNKTTDNVKTNKGYLLNDEGLLINDEGSSITNKLDNTGMYVMKTVAGKTENVLVANADGVQAIDITVKNYLTIGNHTRFEDYIDEDGEERTAAFWI